MLEAVYWYKKAATNGYITADVCYTIALQYTHGLQLPQNEKEAVYWLKIGAELGDSTTQDFLANCYANGDGIEKDIYKATYWWGKAAIQGNQEAQHNISICYEKGIGVKQDLQKASYWRDASKKSK